MILTIILRKEFSLFSIIIGYYLSFKFRILQTPSIIGSIAKHNIIIIRASNALFQLIFVKKRSGGQIDPHRRSRGVAFCRRSSVNNQTNANIHIHLLT